MCAAPPTQHHNLISIKTTKDTNKQPNKQRKDKFISGLSMPLPSNLKNLYAEWLQEFIGGLSSRQEQLTLTYEKARRNLIETEAVIYYPRDLKKIKGIGDTIMRRLEKRLHEHCAEIGVPPPESIVPTDINRGTKRATTLLRSKSSTDVFDEASTHNPNEGPPLKKQRKYIPRKRSGGYGILLGLLELNAISKGISREDLVEVSQKYCDTSMNPNFMTRELRGAWSSVNSLKKHNLVLEQGRPKIYYLTEEGLQLARTLKLAAGINFPKDNLTELPPNDEDLEFEVTANLSELLGSDKSITRAQLEMNSSYLMDITFQESNNIPGGQPTEPIEGRSLFYASPSSGLDLTVSQSNATSEVVSTKERTLRRRFDGISYELWPKGSYEVYPVIDHREIKSQANRDFFSNALCRKGMKCEIRQLALGDIIWVAKNKKTGNECVINTIIERKRLDDLAISIRDNRFMEQKSRLDKSGCKNKYYLIEETTARNMEGMTEALKTAFWLILVYYRFSMIRTTNSDETVEKLHALHTVINEGYSKKDLIVIYPHELKNQDDYRCVLEKFRSEFERRRDIECCHSFQCFQDILGKGELSTVGELTIRILMFIKGISVEKAVAIQTLFPTLNHILTAYSDCNSKEEANMLMFNALGQAAGAKKITKHLSEKIADVFANF